MGYWHDVFTRESWAEFVAAGSNTSGFPERRWNSVQKIRVGDILICYMVGVSRWFGALEVTSEPYRDYNTRIWSDDIYPCRVHVRPLTVLNPDTAISAVEMLRRLNIFEKVRDGNVWGLVLRGSPRRLSEEDGEMLLTELRRLSAATTTEDDPGPGPITSQRRHRELQRKLREIGETLGKHIVVEYRSPPYVYDVVWKDTEGLPRPSHVFEVQDKGSVDLALAKLQHARDMWRPKLFLVVTGESDKAKVDLLLKPYLEGTFHGISKDTKVLTGEIIDQLHHPFTEYREAIIEFVER